MNKRVLSILGRGFVILAMVSSLIVLALTSFWIGQIAGALTSVRSAERPMCTDYATDIRESPTGYVIGHIPEDTMVWFIKLDLPFAHVAYNSGIAWLEGTVTASVLKICE